MHTLYMDFETEEIMQRPHYPPKPVGLAYAFNDDEPRYLAWDHCTGNNVTVDVAKSLLFDVLGDVNTHVVCHNAAFDIVVAGQLVPEFATRSALPAHRIHDTQWLGFLNNPYEYELGLKPLAAKYLGMPPEEADEVRQWLVDHGLIRSAVKHFGARISKAPGELVGKYAIGDIVRTRALFKLWRQHLDNPAYTREQRVFWGLRESEDRGIRIDRQLLDEHQSITASALEQSSAWIKSYLGHDLNIDAPGQLASACKEVGILVGNSVSKKTAQFSDPQFSQVLTYYNQAKTIYRNFLSVWDRMSAETGRIYTQWNTTRGEGGGGARTGRMSSTPNFQNIPARAVSPLYGMPALPRIRDLILPDDGDVILHRDYSGQEPRILAHYCHAAAQQPFHDNPSIKVHKVTQDMLAAAGYEVDYDMAKKLGLSIINGQGLDATAKDLRTTPDQVREMRRAYLTSYPGLQELIYLLRDRAARGQTFRTWGGRNYTVEPPRRGKDGRMQTFEYKMINHLIQGSAADVTKEALARLWEAAPTTKVILQVHDEINVSGAPEDMETLEHAMSGVQMKVLMYSEGKILQRWGDAK